MGTALVIVGLVALAWGGDVQDGVEAPEREAYSAVSVAAGMAARNNRGVDLGLGVTHQVSDILAVHGRGWWAAEPEPPAPTRNLTFDPPLYAYATRPRWRVEALVGLAPITGRVGRARLVDFAVEGALGFGAQRTVDIDWITGCNASHPCSTTKRQVHPTLVLGGGVRVERGRLLGRFDVHATSWVEAYNAVNLESHTRTTAQVSLGIRLGRGEE